MKSLVILGSTGSIGLAALDVARQHPDKYRIVGLAAGSNQAQLFAQAREFGVQQLALANEPQDQPAGVKLIHGQQAACELIRNTQPDMVLNGISGAAGFLPSLTAIESGCDLALANKESLVIGGRLVTGAARPGQIVAVDSEHSAFAQALRSGRADEVRRLILTASGGPFRGRTRDELVDVTPQQAMAHPTWDMGRVITINSATLVNKGLELIEAALLYDVDLDDVVVTVHPQSVVHSMVEFHDGATIAQASPPDMRLPIGIALTWPERLADASAPCDWTTAATWTFEPLDGDTFGAVELARTAGKAAGTAPAVFNAANEALVDAFWAGRIGFLDITDINAEVVAEHLTSGHVTDNDLTVDAVLAADAWGRARAAEIVEARA